jgi:integrase
LRKRIRTLHYSLSTEEAYVRWCRTFIRFHGLRHPADMGGPEVEAFLTWLACERSVSASTHKQALSALLFLYSRVLGVQLPWMAELGRPRVHRRLPVVLTSEELVAVFRGLDGEHLLFAKLLYGTGMRLSEGLQMRVKDVDFAHRSLVVRAGKGGKDRLVMLPQSLMPALREQLARGHACGRPIASKARPESRCQMRLSASTLGLVHRGRGSGFSRRPPTRPTPAAA